MAKEQESLPLRERQELQTNKRYRGSAMINEYGEIDFRAYQEKADDEKKFKTVKSEGDETSRFAISLSDKCVCFRLTIQRADRIQNEKRLRDLFIRTLIKFKEYEI